MRLARAIQLHSVHRISGIFPRAVVGAEAGGLRRCLRGRGGRGLGVGACGWASQPLIHTPSPPRARRRDWALLKARCAGRAGGGAGCAGGGATQLARTRVPNSELLLALKRACGGDAFSSRYPIALRASNIRYLPSCRGWRRGGRVAALLAGKGREGPRGGGVWVGQPTPHPHPLTPTRETPRLGSFESPVRPPRLSQRAAPRPRAQFQNIESFREPTEGRRKSPRA